jgi:F0F1-type ATP synthase membrane subunit b/b'
MGNLDQAAQQVKQALDKIAQAKDNPQQLQQMINDAKAKVDQLVQQANE